MPHGAGDASLLAATLPTPRVKDLHEANAALRRLLGSEATVKIFSIPFDRLRLLIFADSSLGAATGGTAQIATMTCGTDKSLLDGAEAPVS